MSKDLKALVNKGAGLVHALRELEKEVERFNDEYDRSAHSVEERSEMALLYSSISHLSEGAGRLEKLGKPVKAQGHLQKQPNGRYELDGIELSSGYPVEVYDEEDELFWSTRLEHNGEDYYLVALGRTTPIEGRLCRLR